MWIKDSDNNQGKISLAEREEEKLGVISGTESAHLKDDLPF